VIVTCLPQVMPIPEALGKRLQDLRGQGRAAEAVELPFSAWYSPRMFVMQLLLASLPYSGKELPPPAVKRLLGECATRGVVAWLLESIISVGCGEYCWAQIVTCDL
jgi:hypothetical protein